MGSFFPASSMSTRRPWAVRTWAAMPRDTTTGGGAPGTGGPRKAGGRVASTPFPPPRTGGGGAGGRAPPPVHEQSGDRQPEEDPVPERDVVHELAEGAVGHGQHDRPGALQDDRRARRAVDGVQLGEPREEHPVRRHRLEHARRHEDHEIEKAERGRRDAGGDEGAARGPEHGDRKSTRLNSSHTVISYAVFCLKKKKKNKSKR